MAKTHIFKAIIGLKTIVSKSYKKKNNNNITKTLRIFYLASNFTFIANCKTHNTFFGYNIHKNKFWILQTRVRYFI